ncbi:hypothetical protein H8K35_14655 [Undibacterium sp. LX40W]|uniref:Lipoprotein n=1 Tax=Undibacterium nitidum TaxID=2762298 RepID=A0A923KM82_9BURK|nr:MULTISPECIES: hypothetical protein [Undibacterium]MBC3882630.1 hypothetical protein [Undibacterium nitidum]MBC3892911.1 hypothetical protein [Undibacterium sp. LX40W]
MKFLKLLLPIFLFVSLIACGNPVPQAKSVYVGEWQEKTMYLLITQDGSVRYKRLKDGVTTSLEAPLKGFTGDNFEVGIGPMSTTFIVNQAPHQEGDKWKMVVDGIELVKAMD